MRSTARNLPVKTLLVFLIPIVFIKQCHATTLQVIHINDFHARFEETARDSSACKEGDCIGGFSRVYAAIMRMKYANPDALIMNAGDSFQGTLWYNIHKWRVMQHFLNKIPFDATVLGNHEFDDKIAGVVPFITNLQSPVVMANVDDSEEPTIQGTYKKSVVVERFGKKIGIIGVIIKGVNYIANTEKLKFLDESESVNAEAERLVREEGVFTNIVLSHCGYEVDQRMARNATGKIGLIVGGHSHSLLYTGSDVPSADIPRGPYPTVVNRIDGNPVLIVQAAAFSKYLGNLTVQYDESGNCVKWEGQPIYLDSSYPQDPDINRELAQWKVEVDAVGKSVIGRSLVLLDSSTRRFSECLMGNFVTDAMIHTQILRAKNGSWTHVAVAITNAGGLRANIRVGNITFADMIAAQPFRNTLDVGELRGSHLLEMLEFSAEPYFHGKDYKPLNLLHFSGIRTVFDITKPPGQRVQSVKIRCNECLVPRYEPLDLDKMYRVVMPSFLRNGGNKFFVVRDNLKNLEIGDVDIDAYLNYVKTNSPIMKEIEGRIHIIGQEEVIVKDSM